MKQTKLKLEIEVLSNFPLTKEELYAELLQAENRMNYTGSKLRFHMLPVEDDGFRDINPVFKNITKEWFVDKFFEITEEIMNGEEAEDVEFEYTDTSLKITFSVNAHRYGFNKGCSVKINENGTISVNLDDTPLDGCGVDRMLGEAIIEVIDENYLKP